MVPDCAEAAATESPATAEEVERITEWQDAALVGTVSESIGHLSSPLGRGTSTAPTEEVGGTEGKPKSKSPLVLAMLHVKWASFLQSSGQHARAVEHFTLSLAFFPSARAHFGKGTCLAALRKPQEAVEEFEEALRLQPTMVGACVNLAGVFLSLHRFEEAAQYCHRALKLEPQSREAVMNMANALRNLGRREEAVALVWDHILTLDQDTFNSDAMGEAGNKRIAVPMAGAKLRCGEWCSRESERLLPLTVVCVKWGSRYNAAYVNRLHSALRRQPAFADVPFICFTEDGNGLDGGIELRFLPEGLPLWWGKAYLFSECAGLDGRRVLYLDLDQVIVGDITDLTSYTGPFAVLATDGIACELARGGYNSSVMAWEASAFFRPLYELLSKAVRRFVHRFDHWLEMMVEGADLWQDVAPGRIVDFTTAFRGGVCIGSGQEEAAPHDGLCSFVEPKSEAAKDVPPLGTAVVTFPRSPKPHEVLDQYAWVRRHWLGETEPRVC